MTKDVRSWLKNWMKNNPENNFAQGIVMATDQHTGELNMEDLLELRSSDIIEIEKELTEEELSEESFGLFTELIKDLKDMKSQYREGIIRMDTFNRQASLRIIQFVTANSRLGTCICCDKAKVGTMQFICDDCQKAPE